MARTRKGMGFSLVTPNGVGAFAFYTLRGGVTMNNRKQFEENVNLVRKAILAAIPAGDEFEPSREIGYDAIIKALGQVIALMIDSMRYNEDDL